MIWSPFDKSLKADPYPHYAEQMKQASLFLTPSRILFALDHQSVKYVLKRHDEFRSTFPSRGANYSFPALDRVMDHCLLVNEGSKHSDNRKIMSESYQLEGLESHVAVLCHELIDKLNTQTVFDLVQDFILPVATGAMLKVMGFSKEVQAQAYGWSARLLRSVDIFVDSRSLLEMDKASEEFEAHVKRLLNSGTTTGFVAHLSEKLGESMSQNEAIDKITSMAATLLFTGINTTVGLIGSALLQMLSDPKLWNELKAMHSAEGTVHERALDELIRMNNSVHFTFRFANKPTRIGDIEIPANQVIALCLASANRDSAVFDRPNELVWDRKPNPHLAFGVGKHYCFGASLARMQLKTVLTALVSRLPDLTLSEDKPSFMRYNFVRAPESIIVKKQTAGQ